jgi:glycosyl transferase, family 25
MSVIGHVINLERRVDRKRRFLEWNGGHGVDFAFHGAVDGRGIAREALVAQGLLAPQNGRYTNGALGNALSHRALWLRCRDQHEPMLVFEDDACLRLGFLGHLRSALAEAGTDWDILFLGYNTNAAIAVITPEALYGVIVFDDQAKQAGGYFEKYAHAAPEVPSPRVLVAMRAWGTLGYAISPRGAARLLEVCFPLSQAGRIRLQVEGREVEPMALDGMINLALQEQRVSGRICFPPIVSGPNDETDVGRPPQ